MKNLLLTFLFIFCGMIPTIACESCMLGNGYSQEYHYKGNVRTAHKVETCKYLDSLGNEKTDTMSVIFNFFDQKHNCVLFDYENRSTGSSAYVRREFINGKYEVVESRGPFPIRNSHRIYSDKGILREERLPYATRLFDSKGKLYCTITYESVNSKKIAKYEYVFYDKRGKDMDIFSTDRYYNVISHIKKVYDKRGNLTEEYKDGKLTSYHWYDSKGRLLSDSTNCGKNTYTYDSKGNILTHQGTNDCLYAGENKIPQRFLIKYEYGKEGDKTVQEFVNGELDNIERYDKNGNRTYFRRYSCCPKIECKYKYDEKNKEIECLSTYFNDNGTYTHCKNGDDFNRKEYRNDTLVYISFYEEKKVDNKLIITKNEGREDDTLKGKLNIDTIISVTTFDKNGKTLTKCFYHNSEETNCSRYTYNDGGLLLSIVHDKGNYNTDNYEYETRIDYQYDDHNNLMSETHRNGDKIVRQTTNLYDAGNHLVEVKTVKKDGGYECVKYDKVGNVVECVISEKASITISTAEKTILKKNPTYVTIMTYNYYNE